MRILAIDPGTTESAWVKLEDDRILEKGKHDNRFVLSIIAASIYDQLVIEMIASYGMAVGKEVFETVLWIGKFEREAEIRQGKTKYTIGQSVEDIYGFHRLFRAEVKSALCHSQKANDSNIRQALIDRFGPGKEKAIGTKKNPGPLYGIAGDVWAALAVAVTYADQDEARKTA